MAIFTPWSSANLARLIQYGATFFSHCQASTSRYSGGQGQVTQLGYLALSLSPGQPEKSITTGTPSFWASRIVFLLVSAFVFPIAAFGCRGLPWQLSALMEIPLSSRSCLKSFSSCLFCNMDSLQCG